MISTLFKPSKMIKNVGCAIRISVRDMTVEKTNLEKLRWEFTNIDGSIDYVGFPTPKRSIGKQAA